MRLAALDTFLAWQDDFGATSDCCLLHPPEPGDDPPDCADCDYRRVSAGLGSDDYRALDAYRVLARPVVRDLRLTEAVMAGLGLRLTRHDAIDWLDRLDLIHRYRAAQAATGARTGGPDDDVV